MLLSAKYVFPITGEPIIDGAVLVRGNEIADIGEFSALQLRYPDEELTDYGLAAILPGFVNLHTRLEQSVLRGVVEDQPHAHWTMDMLKTGTKLENVDWYDSAILGGLDALSSGITTVADISSSGNSGRAMQELGLRGVIYREVGAIDKTRVDYAVSSAERDINRWKERFNPERITVGIAPAVVYANHPCVFRRVSQLAIREDLPVAMRLAGSREEYDFVKRGSSVFATHMVDSEAHGYVERPPWMPFGESPVRYVLNWDGFEADNVLLVHAVYVNEDDIRKLRERDVAICVCPRTNAQLGMGVARLNDFLQAGLRVGLGTGSQLAAESTDMLAEMRAGLLVYRATNTRRFLSSSTILEMATIGGARALRMEDKIGSLEVGKRADIIALDLSESHQTYEMNPVSTIVNTCTSNDVLMTMVDGSILYEKNHWHVDFEVAKNIARVLEIRAKLKA